MKGTSLNVFSGAESLRNFLNPENHPPLPLVELPEALNPYRRNGVRIYLKMMNFLPLGNVKSLPAYNMLLAKEPRLTRVHTMIENSSGNTAFSLAVLGRLFGISRTKAIVSHEVSEGKLKLLRFLGAEVIVNREPICPDPNDHMSGIYKAKVWAQKNNWFNPGQYDNKANPEAHEKWTGPQIWQQTEGHIDLLCAGLGTTGTIVGTSKYLKERNQKIQVVGVTRKPNNPVPGVRTVNLLQEIAFDWKGCTDALEEVGTVESFKKSLELCRAGLLVGPSSGFCLQGLLNYLEKNFIKLDNQKELVCVCICPDSPFPYIDEYFATLDAREFPKIENEELLKNVLTHKNLEVQTVPEIEATEAFRLLQDKKVIILDIRRVEEFEDFHIEHAVHYEEWPTEKQLKQKKFKNKKIIFVCRRGDSSRIATYKARLAGIDAVSLKGGMIEWSRVHLPRVRSEVCTQRFNL